MSDKKLKTRERILIAASQVFAERGFEKGTVRDICTRAGANVAAVNYHFRDKHELYVQVLDAWEKEGDEMYPIDNGVPSDAPVRDRMKGLYGSFLKRIFYSGNDPEVSYQRARVIMHEIAAGTYGHKRENDAYCRMEEVMRSFLVEVMPGAPAILVQDCLDSSLSQLTSCFMGFVYAPHEFEDNLSKDELERMAEHMTVFSLGGISAAMQASNLEAKFAA